MKTKGFTLIELLVTITIIGILSAIVIVNFVGSRKKAQDAKIKQDLSALSTAVLKYETETGSLPDKCGWMSNNNCLSVLVPKYISRVTTQGPNDKEYMYFKKNYVGSGLPNLGSDKYAFYAILNNPSAQDQATISDSYDRMVKNKWGMNYRLGN